jgi:hypothetical protein
MKKYFVNDENVAKEDRPYKAACRFCGTVKNKDELTFDKHRDSHIENINGVKFPIACWFCENCK